MRLLLGALLVVGGLLWAKQNQASLAGAEAVAGATGDIGSAKQQAVSLLQVLGHADTKPLSLSFLPAGVTNLFDSFNPVVAGALLVLSAFLFALLLALFEALVAFGGHKFGVVPDFDPLQASHLTALAGLACGAVAVLAFRRPRD